MSLTRRRLLATGAAVATGATAGCLGGFLGGGNNSSNSSATPTPEISAIEGYGADGNSLVVRVADDADTEKLDGFRLISPDGSEDVDKAELEGTNEVKLSLVNNGNPISPGNYTVQAAYSDKNVDDSVELRAEPKVTKVKLVAGRTSQTPQVTVTNTGMLPVKMQYVGFPDKVPSPNSPSNDVKSQGMVGLERVNEGNDPLLSKGEEGTFKGSNRNPFYFKSQQKSDIPKEFQYDPSNEQQIRNQFCNGETVDTELVVIIGGDRLTYPASITYDGKVKIEDSGDNTFICSNVSASFENTSRTASGNGTGSVNGSEMTSS